MSYHISLTALVADDEPQIRTSFGVMLKSMGFKDVIAAPDSREVMPLLLARTKRLSMPDDSAPVSVVLLDLSMPHRSGTELLGDLTAAWPHLPVIIITAKNDIDTAVKCMRSGAFDYLVKPVEKARFESSIRRATEVAELRSEVSSLKTRLLSAGLAHEDAFAGIVTVNRKMRAIFQYVEAIAPSDRPVLITGETGVGKELIARAVHDISRPKGGFVAVNAAGLDDTMFSDALFGHVKGAYTGADAARGGLILEAAGGTLFLDEIGDAGDSSQVKLLRLLQERKYYPLGSDTPMMSDVRVVVATNHDLSALMAAGKFRKDLYYRLAAHQVFIPPLRERPEDIPLLVGRFIEEAARAMNKKRPTAPPELVTLLRSYHLPGNVRELQAMIHDAVARHKSGVLSLESFKNAIGGGRMPPRAVSGRSVNGSVFDACSSENLPTLKEAGEQLTARALELAGGNQGIAAMLLGITRQALNKRLSRRSGR
ncbi:MAG: sigma-54-dependent Fis family transcriptional regulator [Deltaproteobacteria bacterium]|nr:sigma-54-dependent Fis family transcriptional regulator [Deltaproteobacteria bacterium]